MTELALLRRARSDHAGARELLERAVAADGEYPPARSHLGALLVEAGEEARGRAELEAAIRLNPVDWRLHVTAAQAYEARGLSREALEAWKRGVELLWQARLGRGRDEGSD
jgi:tetratricopeptide (TPR) repeat protein